MSNKKKNWTLVSFLSIGFFSILFFFIAQNTETKSENYLKETLRDFNLKAENVDCSLIKNKCYIDNLTGSGKIGGFFVRKVILENYLKPPVKKNNETINLSFYHMKFQGIGSDLNGTIVLNRKKETHSDNDIIDHLNLSITSSDFFTSFNGEFIEKELQQNSRYPLTFIAEKYTVPQNIAIELNIKKPKQFLTSQYQGLLENNSIEEANYILLGMESSEKQDPDSLFSNFIESLKNLQDSGEDDWVKDMAKSVLNNFVKKENIVINIQNPNNIPLEELLFADKAPEQLIAEDFNTTFTNRRSK